MPREQEAVGLVARLRIEPGAGVEEQADEEQHALRITGLGRVVRLVDRRREQAVTRVQLEDGVDRPCRGSRPPPHRRRRCRARSGRDRRATRRPAGGPPWRSAAAIGVAAAGSVADLGDRSGEFERLRALDRIQGEEALALGFDQAGVQARCRPPRRGSRCARDQPGPLLAEKGGGGLPVHQLGQDLKFLGDLAVALGELGIGADRPLDRGRRTGAGERWKAARDLFPRPTASWIALRRGRCHALGRPWPCRRRVWPGRRHRPRRRWRCPAASRVRAMTRAARASLSCVALEDARRSRAVGPVTRRPTPGSRARRSSWSPGTGAPARTGPFAAMGRAKVTAKRARRAKRIDGFRFRRAWRRGGGSQRTARRATGLVRPVRARCRGERRSGAAMCGPCRTQVAAAPSILCGALWSFGTQNSCLPGRNGKQPRDR